MVFQKILNELEKIQWEVERVQNNVLMVKSVAEKLFSNGEEILKRPYWERRHHRYSPEAFRENPRGDGNSCVLCTKGSRVSSGDKNFVRITEYLDLVLQPLVENNPCILFSYIISKRGMTRGYPWKDFSVLPPGFDPTQHSFFYIADEKHNRRRRVKWTEPYLCPLIKTWMVTCSAPVWNHSRFIGVIGIDFNLGRIIEPLGQALKLTDKGYGFIISPKGNIIVSSDAGMVSLQEDRIWIEGKWKDLTWRKALFENPSKSNSLPMETQISEIQLTSGKRYLLYTFIKTTGWSLIVLLPKRTVGAIRNRIPLEGKKENPDLASYQGNGVYLPLMSFVSAYSKSLQQMEELIEGTKMIGKGVLDHRIKVNRKDEIGLIAHSINRMAKELKKRKEEFESAYKKISQLDRLMAMGRLTAGIAHEINNPLGVISNYVQVLLRNESLSSAVKIDLMLIEEEILGMIGIIRGLLNFARESEMQKSFVSLNEVLRKTVALLKFQLNSQSIKLVENYEDDLPSVHGDSNHLQQVFLNILLNSIQSMPEGGTLHLRTSLTDGNGPRRSNEWVLVEVLDTGIGIESKYLDKIFDPFFTTKGWGAGTGLGLSISYGIIKEHGGNIDVKSNPGEGTLVQATLPVPKDS